MKLICIQKLTYKDKVVNQEISFVHLFWKFWAVWSNKGFKRWVWQAGIYKINVSDFHAISCDFV